ncbi:hypothetical protein PR003_g16868 [Phytophthora rubi]|uniref:Secreted protein n=1 Tax=Phytophthora rubi TaxID=129364 RepID=A0A6A4EVC1_9STRA|nr:hypothetical protein PR001_g22089 [Phytophthora rubi]KAE9006401.1 hypothetical protein PR002_g16492 [Phytophthora rubi]KAE9323869.1 hypothetical protein PR003_g16868 [Phytophthora rubi]
MLSVRLAIASHLHKLLAVWDAAASTAPVRKAEARVLPKLRTSFVGASTTTSVSDTVLVFVRASYSRGRDNVRHLRELYTVCGSALVYCIHGHCTVGCWKMAWVGVGKCRAVRSSFPVSRAAVSGWLKM